MAFPGHSVASEPQIESKPDLDALPVPPVIHSLVFRHTSH